MVLRLRQRNHGRASTQSTAGMGTTSTYIVALAYLLSATSVATTKNCAINSKYQTLVALIDLRSGATCKNVNLHGVQQLAIIQSTLNQINDEFLNDNITIKLQVFDTCSTLEGTRLATLKSLVATQQTCLETPFLLGFIGPDRFLGSVRLITKVFKAAHVIPYYESATVPEGVFTVSSYPVHQHSQVLKSIVKEMGLARLVIVYERGEMTRRKFDDFAGSVPTDVCILGSIAVDGAEFSITSHVDTESADAIVFLTDSPSIVVDMMNTVSRESVLLPTTVIFSLSKLSSFVWPRKLKHNIYILQMVGGSKIEDLSNNADSSLLNEWSHQKVTECLAGNDSLISTCSSLYSTNVASRQQDWSVVPLHYGVLLYASAVRIIKSTCLTLGDCQNSKWMKTLHEASLFVKPENSSQLSQKITFGMDLLSKFSIMYVRQTGGVVQIGEFESGHLNLRQDFQFSPVPHVNWTGCSSNKKTIHIEKPQVTHVPISSTEGNIIEFFENIQNAQGYELIALLAGGCAGIILIMWLAFYSVYRGVNPKSRRSRRSSLDSTGTAGS